MIRQRRFGAVFLCAVALLSRSAYGDAYDPPPTYYTSATGTGATLKSQLHALIDAVDDPIISDVVATSLSYDSARTNLQVTDVDPNDSSRIILVYNNRQSIPKPTGGAIPGWDGGVTWNREHSWPQSRGVDSTSGPDGSDLHHLFPSDPGENSTRNNFNFGGVYGAQGYGLLNDGGTKYYPGNLDAGMIARAQFYMAVRYNGTEANTMDLELAAGNPADNGAQLGDLNRLIEWNFTTVPDTYERRRNQVIYDNYQHNRNPFIDHPEWVWSVFVKDINNNPIPNDSQIGISGSTVNANGSSTRNVDLGRVFTGAVVPAAQNFTLNKTGLNGTYFEVTTAGVATSSLSGHYNAFKSSQTDNKTITVGLNTNTTAAGLRSGTVSVDNLDVTPGSNGGVGHGANDANDTFNVSLTVLDHATPSFVTPGPALTTLSHDFGTVNQGGSMPSFSFDVTNLLATAGFTANMDFDNIASSGTTSAFDTSSLTTAAGSLVLAGGASQTFATMLNTAAIGLFSATYTLNFSDENIAGALNKSLMLTLMGNVQAALLAGDYNQNGVVDAGDYTLWRSTLGQSVTAFSGADGNGSGSIDAGDYDVWTAHFGQTAGAGAGVGAFAAVPEPGALLLLLCGVAAGTLSRKRRRDG